MQNVGATILATVLSVLVTLVVTLIFNKLVAMPAAIKKEKEAHRQEIGEMKQELADQKLLTAEQAEKIVVLQAAVDALPNYRQQSLGIQQELRNADAALLTTCETIQEVLANLAANTDTSINLLQNSLNALKVGQDAARESLARLEAREKNTLRSKIIAEYNLFTNSQRNPEHAWSEMEHHAFFALVSDYEDLGGNDYVHGTVIPAMNTLEVVPMENLDRLTEIMRVRKN